VPRPLAQSAEPDPVAFQGEIWTDGRGYATVQLPAGAASLEPPLEYELRNLEGGGGARVSGELKDGHFAIETDEPHVKVAWRIAGRRAADERGD
jgi:hypothetical protein